MALGASCLKCQIGCNLFGNLIWQYGTFCTFRYFLYGKLSWEQFAYVLSPLVISIIVLSSEFSYGELFWVPVSLSKNCIGSTFFGNIIGHIVLCGEVSWVEFIW